MNINDPLYVEFLYAFNVTRDYYECHEVLEELWLEEGRNRHIQGLLQVAVGLYHFENDNVSGAIQLFDAGLSKLSNACDASFGIDMAALRDATAAYVSKLRHFEEEPFAFETMTIHIIDPKLDQLVHRCATEQETSD